MNSENMHYRFQHATFSVEVNFRYALQTISFLEPKPLRTKFIPTCEPTFDDFEGVKGKRLGRRDLAQCFRAFKLLSFQVTQ